MDSMNDSGHSADFSISFTLMLLVMRTIPHLCHHFFFIKFAWLVVGLCGKGVIILTQLNSAALLIDCILKDMCLV